MLPDRKQIRIWNLVQLNDLTIHIISLSFLCVCKSVRCVTMVALCDVIQLGYNTKTLANNNQRFYFIPYRCPTHKICYNVVQQRMYTFTLFTFLNVIYKKQHDWMSCRFSLFLPTLNTGGAAPLLFQSLRFSSFFFSD